MGGDEVDALSDDGPRELIKFVRWFFEASKDMKGCKDDVAECDVSYWMMVTRSKECGEEVVEVLA